MRQVRLNLLIGAISGLCFLIVYFFSINYISFPWIDEIGTTDTSVNFVKYGIWGSHVWNYTYHPLHAFLLIPWLKVLGVSHLSVCSFSAVLAYACYLALLKILVKRKILLSPAITIVFCVLFWFGFNSTLLIPMGRIDFLVCLFTILLANELIPIEGVLPSSGVSKTVVYSALLMFTAIYSIPLLMVFCLIVLALYKDIRKQLLLRYVAITISFIFAFGLVCLFFKAIDGLDDFLYSLIIYNETISGDVDGLNLLGRIRLSYLLDLASILVLITSGLLLFIQRKSLNSHHWAFFVFVAIIPILMTLLGRYKIYYSWLFYIPVLVIFIYSLSKQTNKLLIIGAITILSVTVYYRVNIIINSSNQKRESMLLAMENMEKAGDWFKCFDNVVFINPMYYYSLVEKDVIGWYKWNGLQDKVSRKNQDSYLPIEGYVLVDNKEDEENVLLYMQEHNYAIEHSYKDADFKIYSFKR